jgi:hypothetical protein
MYLLVYRLSLQANDFSSAIFRPSRVTSNSRYTLVVLWNPHLFGLTSKLPW